jgi:hypothetical protein
MISIKYMVIVSDKAASLVFAGLISNQRSSIKIQEIVCVFSCVIHLNAVVFFKFDPAERGTFQIVKEPNKLVPLTLRLRSGLIPEATDGQPKSLIVVVPVGIAIVIAQVAVPSKCRRTRRAPPATAEANRVECSSVDGAEASWET